MPVSFKSHLLPIIFLFSAFNAFSQSPTYSLIPKKDTANVYKQMLNDNTDDLMENHPAEDIYNRIWTSERINPYKIPIDSLPDSVRIDCSNFHIPVPGAVTSVFGQRRYRYHYGTDLRLNVGDTVRSSFSGKVRIIDYEARGYGNYVVIRHDNGLETVYAHLSQVLVALNENIKSGQIIGLGGNTGRSTGPHLHFETRYIGNAINPANIINFDTGTVFNNTYLITKKGSFYYQHAAKLKQAAKYYTVRKGDNLSKIAARNGMSIKSLAKLNGIKVKTRIKKGQRLRVR
ncbi:MAG TPA: M23 family metallopeptidase [Paludibacter sp.]|nr:M23 family metallopeptidase [Paludibacter sp.]